MSADASLSHFTLYSVMLPVFRLTVHRRLVSNRNLYFASSRHCLKVVLTTLRKWMVSFYLMCLFKFRSLYESLNLFSRNTICLEFVNWRFATYLFSCGWNSDNQKIPRSNLQTAFTEKWNHFHTSLSLERASKVPKRASRICTLVQFCHHYLDLLQTMS